MKYYIQNNGCDDSTELAIELTDAEVETFTRICKELNKKSSYQCQPKIALYKYDECQTEKSDYDDEVYVNVYTAKNLLEEE